MKQTLNFDVSGYAFPTATLSFAGLNDGDNASSFYIDDVSLVRVCPPAAEAAGAEIAAAEAAVPESPVSLAEPITGTPPFSTTVFLPWVEKPEQEVDKPAALAALACANVLANGDFEAALPGRPWTGVANSRSAVYNDPLISGTRARTGSRSGRVGSPSVNYYWNELIQTVQLPSNVVSVELSYWHYLDTTETSTTRVYDVFRAGLETDEGIEIVTPQQVDNTSSGRRTWVQKTLSLPNASAYSGRKLWVTFKGTTDGNRPSSLYVDDAQLTVCRLR